MLNQEALKRIVILFTICFSTLTCLKGYTQVLSNADFLKVKKLGPHMMNSTFYLYGPHEQSVTGTAFILARVAKIDSSSMKPDSSYFQRFNKIVYNANIDIINVLVTAAHIFKNIQGDYAYLWLRKKNGDYFEGFEYKFQIRQNGKPLWMQHTSNADVAVMYISLPKETALTQLSHTLLLNNSALNDIGLNAGDDLLCLGFPYSTYSDDVGFPILRSGKYASYRSSSSKVNNFLFDFKIFPGNSGGPVFVDLKSIINDQGEPIITFAGIVGMVVDSLKSSDIRSTIDVSEVVPAELIFETIERLPLPDGAPKSSN